MKKFAIIILLAIAATIVVASYRSYRRHSEQNLRAHRGVAADREKEAQRRAAAQEEARRLARLQAEQEAANAKLALEELREQEAAAERERLAAEAEKTRFEARLRELEAEKERAIAEVRKSNESRRIETAGIEAAQADALAKLRALEMEKIARADRSAGREAVQRRQTEVEKQAQDRATHLRLEPTR